MNALIKYMAFTAVAAVPLVAAGPSVAQTCAGAGLCDTTADSMMKPLQTYSIDPLFTVGETIKGYTPPGILDGIAAYKTSDSRVKLLVNHELSKDEGYAYSLANGTQLTGARVSFFNVSRAHRKVFDAGLAYRKAYDRAGKLVTSAEQINETGDPASTAGFDRFCSSAGYAAGDFGFVDDIYFTHEETSEQGGHPHGGSVWAIDVNDRSIWALPALGRGAWENVTSLKPPVPGSVALAMGDDYGNTSMRPGDPTVYVGVPLYFYIGTKDRSPDASFPARNGLAEGQVYYYKAAARCDAAPTETSPQTFNGTSSTMTGVLCPIAVQDASKAGQPGYDAEGYLNGETLRSNALAAGAFAFSRPEDLHHNPANRNQFVFISTGRGRNFPADDWGTTYIVTTDLAAKTAEVKILYDGDDAGGGQFADPDFGLRSPDNTVWGADGFIYVNEDPATQNNVFGELSGKQPSIWRLNSKTAKARRIAIMDPLAVFPPDATDNGDLWESSGILDVTKLFPTRPGEVLLVSDIQAHGIVDGGIAAQNLVEGGQLFLLSAFKPIW